jgi:hypothetical protein
MAHTCNPSYLGGRAQEDHSSKPAQADSFQDPISKISNTKQGWWRNSQVVKHLPSKSEALSSNHSTARKKKKAGHWQPSKKQDPISKTHSTKQWLKW